ncbi:MAG: branched-chain amino acid transport system substrate-binding protein, partial [Frankiales bacterium]|nr:branched-chain amino acid transport system substrate-binding protein [Frankiales bacterium]
MSGSNRLRSRGTSAALAAVISVLGLTACSSSSSTPASGGTSAASSAATGSAGTSTGAAGATSKAAGFTGKPLVIGASVSLTGDFADPGKAVRAGYQLWADMVNAKGGLLGRKVELKIVDDTSSPTQVVTNYQNLINKDKVDLVFGPFSSLLTVPASQVARRYGY